MKTQTFSKRTHLPEPAEVVFAWHTRPGALECLTPPWEKVRVLERQGGIADHGRVVMAMRLGGLWRRWVAEHTHYDEGREFVDVQREGPFAHWEHRHRMEPDGPAACFLEDRVTYALPLGPLGRLLGGRFTRGQLRRMFAYRHRVTANALHLLRHAGRNPMKVLVSGSHGLVGSALVPFLTTGGHTVVRLVRPPTQPAAGMVVWDPDAGVLGAHDLEGIDAVVHLAGEGIADHRWNTEHKARIRDSRVKGTTLLAETLARMPRPPRVLVTASAIGYYGDRGNELLTEDSSPGSGFLAEVCREWEQATEPAARAGVRVVNLRLGVIQSAKGGALAKMLTPFRFGMGGRIGSGSQYISWVALDDVVGAIHHALTTEALRGPVNAVAPAPVTNAEFTSTLAHVLGRPAFLPMPAFAARFAFGEMANELLLASTRVEPRRLQETGYPFLFPQLDGALRHLLGQEAPAATTTETVGS